MASIPGYLRHRRDWSVNPATVAPTAALLTADTDPSQFKQSQRAERIRALPEYREPFSSLDRDVVSRPISDLVRGVQKGTLNPLDILKTYGKIALKAHDKTNCLTEIMIPSAETWIREGSVNLEGPLAGVPVSLKDTVVVGGYDATVGYSSFVGNATDGDGPMVRLLKAAGAVPYVKTNLPITLLSFESTNDVWGRCTNPHNPRYSPGGSTGGESALLALGGRIGVGSDVAGSVRLPAHWAGCYSLRCSVGRWPKSGIRTSMPGQEGIPSVYSPMARTLEDLTYFTREVVRMRPWVYDFMAFPIAWRDDVEKTYAEKPVLRVGVLRTDGVVNPSPACERAVAMVESALRREGHEIVEVRPPDMYEALRLSSLLLNADGCRMFRSQMRRGEWLDRGAQQMSRLMDLPRPLQFLYYLWVKYVRRDPIWAGLVRDWHPHTAYENWQLDAPRED